MRKFILMCGILTAFSVQARPNLPIADVAIPAQNAVIEDKVFPSERFETIKKVEKMPTDTAKHRSKDGALKPHPTVEKISRTETKKDMQPGYERHSLKNDNNHKKHHRPNLAESSHNLTKNKSGVYVNVNINSPRPRVVKDRIVAMRPVTVVRPVVYENNIYANGSYSCTERLGLKYCTDYRNRALNGRVVQNYGDHVAYENYRRGYQHDVTTVFSQDGLMVQKTMYKNGLKNGKEYVYYDNGKVEYSAEYKKGALHGKIEQYDLNGKKIGQMTYRNGHLQTRRCNQEFLDPEILAQIKQKNYNEVILCGGDCIN